MKTLVLSWLPVFLFALTLLQRLLHRLVHPNDVEFDTQDKIFHASLIRDNRWHIPREHRRLVVPSKFPLPFLYFYFLAIFPKSWEPWVERLINPFLDAGFNAILYLIVFRITGSVEQSAFVALAYLFTPAFFTIQKNGPRTKSATPRLFGEILVNLAFLLTWLAFLEKRPLFYVLAIVLGSAVFLASKFSNQSLTFIGLIAGLLAKRWELAALPFLSFALAVVASGGSVLPVLKNQVDYLIFYCQENRLGKMKAFKRNSLKTLLDALRSRNLEKIAIQTLYRNSFSIVTFQFPLFWVALVAVVLQPAEFFASWLYFPAIFLGAGLTVFLLTNLGPLLFLGHAERYLNHVACFILLIVATTYPHRGLLYAVIAYGIAFQAMDFVFFEVKKRYQIEQDDQSIIDWLNTKSGSRNILVVPLYLGGGWRIVNDTPHNWFFHSDYSKPYREIWNWVVRKHPFIEVTQLPRIVSTFAIDTIIIHEKQCSDFYGAPIACPSGFRPTRINERIQAYEKV